MELYHNFLYQTLNKYIKIFRKWKGYHKKEFGTTLLYLKLLDKWILCSKWVQINVKI